MNANRSRAAVTALLLVLSQVRAQTAVLYVSESSATPRTPYATWATAAKTIQDAVDAAAPGDTVIATNGVYRTGGRVVQRWGPPHGGCPAGSRHRY